MRVKENSNLERMSEKEKEIEKKISVYINSVTLK